MLRFVLDNILMSGIMLGFLSILVDPWFTHRTHHTVKSKKEVGLYKKMVSELENRVKR